VYSRRCDAQHKNGKVEKPKEIETSALTPASIRVRRNIKITTSKADGCSSGASETIIFDHSDS